MLGGGGIFMVSFVAVGIDVAGSEWKPVPSPIITSPSPSTCHSGVDWDWCPRAPSSAGVELGDDVRLEEALGVPEEGVVGLSIEASFLLELGKIELLEGNDVSECHKVGEKAGSTARCRGSKPVLG
jgi:hypothetical protein